MDLLPSKRQYLVFLMLRQVNTSLVFCMFTAITIFIKCSSSVRNILHSRTGPGRVAQSVARLTQAPEVPGSIPCLSGYTLSFLLPLAQDRQLSTAGESMCTKYWLTT